jgi:hypothetical protein
MMAGVVCLAGSAVRRTLGEGWRTEQRQGGEQARVPDWGCNDGDQDLALIGAIFINE